MLAYACSSVDNGASLQRAIGLGFVGMAGSLDLGFLPPDFGVILY
jgi:hypothetical protein